MLTDEGDGLGEAGLDVRGQAVLHGEAEIAQLALVQVGAGGRHVEHRRDARRCQCLPLGRVQGAAQEQEGQQLHGTLLCTTSDSHESTKHSLTA